MKRDIVYECEIAGRQFYAESGNRGLMINERNPNSFYAEIGNAIITFLHTDQGMGMRNKRGYHLCRYDRENVIDLTELSDCELEQFASSFGVPLERDRNYYSGSRLRVFVGSPCHQAAIEWVKKHPRLARRPTYHVQQLKMVDYAALGGRFS